jgi:hypothetical protein
MRTYIGQQWLLGTGMDYALLGMHGLFGTTCRPAQLVQEQVLEASLQLSTMKFSTRNKDVSSYVCCDRGNM